MTRSALPQTENYVRRATETGFACSECGTFFVEPHDHKVCCAFCFGRLTDAEVKAMGVRLATHEEANVAAHISIARKRKAEKQKRGDGVQAQSGAGADSSAGTSTSSSPHSPTEERT